MLITIDDDNDGDYDDDDDDVFLAGWGSFEASIVFLSFFLRIYLISTRGMLSIIVLAGLFAVSGYSGKASGSFFGPF